MYHEIRRTQNPEKQQNKGTPRRLTANAYYQTRALRNSRNERPANHTPFDWNNSAGHNNKGFPARGLRTRRDKGAIMTYEFNLGSYSRPITTSSPEAQLWFDRGLLWTYGFNHEEAVHCFKQAAEADPEVRHSVLGHRLRYGAQL